MKIIRFNAVWCSGCLVMKKIWKEIEKEFSNLDIVSYDYDIDEEMVEKYNIGTTIPVVIFMKDDLELERLVGEKSKQEIIDTILKYR